MNIGDIAEMAGVSRAAVSRYLNNGYISEEKRERIRQVIEETGYKPSVMAQTLRTKKTRLVGVVLPRINSDSISSIVAGIGTALNKNGYDMLLATTDNSPEKELDFLRIFSNNRVDGIILIATVLTREHKRLLKEMKVPAVIVGQNLAGCSCIYHDDLHAGEDLANYMIEQGRKKIGFIGVMKEDVAVGQRRIEGYQKAMADAGLEVLPEMCVTAEFSSQAGYDKMKQLFKHCPDLEGVIAATDSIAFGAMKYLKEIGKEIPKDIAVAGFGDNKIAAVTVPSLTTIHFHYQECGATAAEKIVEQMDGKAHAVMEIKLGYELVKRDSV